MDNPTNDKASLVGVFMAKNKHDLHYWQRLVAISHIKVAYRLTARVRVRVYLGESYPGVYLTLREAECIYNLLMYNKRKCVAELLGISVRTVDYYVAEVKIKLNCHSQKEVLQMISYTDFFTNYQREMQVQECPVG